MRQASSPLCRLALLALTLVIAPATLAAQASTHERSVSLSAGVTQFDASGTGVAPVFALRIDQPWVGHWLLGEGSLGYSPLDEEFSDSPTHFVILEGQMQVQLPQTRVRPYLGVGVGWATYLSNAGGRDRFAATVATAGGIRADVNERIGIRAELRVRAWHGFSAAAAEWTVGMARRY